ncbi:LacI family DNA-binding transcriptional regulator [Paenibacillus spongiae]|uniref:LacI family transcriptional regulator n=1 Tax=Paenibacillus spongiae TaxID=2909671 RepID=A0ABY5S8Z1_9BACL|nr:LacI family DNA-binding transcriptional regulator [Paenibacillus spongiae]UVI30149.1 LacI family transcriptional regulator [Paenibacillus spongiae]
MKPTILHVAERAQVSKATVSRVLNNNPQVKEEIKERVLQAIEELGYRPSAIARNLATSRTNMIGLILPDITNPYFPVLARGIEDAAHRLGYALFISNTDNEPALEREYIRKMVEQQVGGIILISSVMDEETVSDLSSLRMPIVLCDRVIDNAPFDAVLIDDYKAAYEAVNYLIGQGHTRIAHLAGPKDIQSAENRKNGYLDAMREANLEPFISLGSFSYESGLHQMGAVLDDYRPTALFASNDLLALGAMQEIHRRGMSVPQNVAIIGCDDIPFSRMSRPLLSTISIPAYQIGVTAVQLLDDQIKGVSSGAKNVIMEHKLIHRETSGGVDQK